MKEFDVFIAGGAIAGPVSAKFCTKQGLKTLLVEKTKVPGKSPVPAFNFHILKRALVTPFPESDFVTMCFLKLRCTFPMEKQFQQTFPCSTSCGILLMSGFVS